MKNSELFVKSKWKQKPVTLRTSDDTACHQLPALKAKEKGIKRNRTDLPLAEHVAWHR